MNALKFAQVVLLVVENTQGKFSKLDLQIARKCLDEGRALVIAANKGDLAFFMGIGPR
jgi:GTPase